jgi:hypothetical protein
MIQVRVVLNRSWSLKGRGEKNYPPRSSTPPPPPSAREQKRPKKQANPRKEKTKEAASGSEGRGAQ